MILNRGNPNWSVASNCRRIALALAAAMAAFIGWGFLGQQQRAIAAPPSERPGVDERLLRDLDDPSESVKTPEKKPNQPPAGAPDKLPDVAPKKPRAAASAPPARVDQTPRKNEVAPAAAAGKASARDEQLLKDLDGGDVPAAGPHDAKPGDDLGSDADPLTRIGTKMRAAVTLIDQDKLSGKTTELQDDIVHDLDTLIKQQCKKMQKQQPSPQSQARRNSSSRDKVEQPKKPSQGKSEPSPAGTGQEEAKKPADESSKTVRKDQQAPPRLDTAALLELRKKVWGNLPAKDREQVLQGAKEELLPQYETLIEKYFRRLADEAETQP